MTDYSTYLQTIAAISSAIAAIAAAWVAKNTFTFQKVTLLKKTTVDQIQELFQQLSHLKLLTGQAALDIPDESFIGLSSLISKTRNSVAALESMSSAAGRDDLKKIQIVVNSLHEENIFATDDNKSNVAISEKLDEAIRALHNIYRKEVK